MRQITHLIIHCTDSPDSAINVGVNQVRDWHVNGNGWSDIGYHWLIDKQARICQGRKEKTSGAHARGYNSISVGMVWVGRNDCHEKQWTSLVLKGAEIVRRFDIPVENILGHCELPGVSKTCPNLNMTKYRNAVMQIIRG